MTKQSGLSMALWVDGADLSGDTMAIDKLTTSQGLWEVPPINATAMSRLQLQRSGQIAVTSFWNTSAGAAHVTWDTLPRTDRYSTLASGPAQGAAAASVYGLQNNYDPTRDADGKLTAKVQIDSDQYGLEWGVLLTGTTDGTRTDTSATNGTGLDNGASSAFGLQAYLHVLAFTGTSVTVTLQHSSDNGGVDPYAAITGGAFTAATTTGAQRIATATGLTIKRYVRIATTGTFSNARFAVNMVRNSATPVF